MELLALVGAGAVGYHMLKKDVTTQKQTPIQDLQMEHPLTSPYRNPLAKHVYTANRVEEVNHEMQRMAERKIKSEEALKNIDYTNVTAYDPEKGRIIRGKEIPQSTAIDPSKMQHKDTAEVEKALASLRKEVDSKLQPAFKGLVPKGAYDPNSTATQVKLEMFSGVPSTEDAGTFAKQRREKLNDDFLQNFRVNIFQKNNVYDVDDLNDRVKQSLGSKQFNKDYESVVKQQRVVPNVNELMRAKARDIDETRNKLNPKKVYESVIVGGQKGQERAPLPPSPVNRWELLKINTVEDFYPVPNEGHRKPVQLGEHHIEESRLMESYEVEPQGPPGFNNLYNSDSRVESTQRLDDDTIRNRDAMLQSRVYDASDERLNVYDAKPVALHLPPMIGDYNFKEDRSRMNLKLGNGMGGVVSGQNPSKFGQVIRERVTAPMSIDRTELRIQGVTQDYGIVNTDFRKSQQWERKAEYVKPGAIYNEFASSNKTGFYRELGQKGAEGVQLKKELGDTFRFHPGLDRGENPARMSPTLTEQKRELSVVSFGLPSASRLAKESQVERMIPLKPEKEQVLPYSFAVKRQYTPQSQRPQTNYKIKNRPMAQGRF